MSFLSRFGFSPATSLQPPAGAWSYEAAMEQAEQRERARLEDIRRKAEANEAVSRANTIRARCLGLDRAGHAL